MQEKQKQDQQQESRSTFGIKRLGKLPKSSYYDVPLSKSVSSRSISMQDASTHQTQLFTSPRVSESENTTRRDSGADTPNAALAAAAAAQLQRQDSTNSNTNGGDGAFNENLEIWSVVFAPDESCVAWSCGYGIIKLQRWIDSSSSSHNSCCSSTSSSASTSGESSPLGAGSPTNESELHRHMQWARQQQQQQLAVESMPDLVEIETGGQVSALAIGSSRSSLKYARHSKHRPSVYRRFHFDEHQLILAVGLTNGRIRLYDANTGHFLFLLFDHADAVRHLKFTKDGSLQLASASADSTVKLWNLYDDGNMYRTLRGHVGAVHAVDWSPNAPLLCSVGANRQVLVWNTHTFEQVHQLRGHLHDVSSCEFSPDGALLATASFDTKVCLWNPYTGELLRELLHLVPAPSFIYAGGHNGSYLRALTFSSNGDHLVTVCDDRKVRVWSLVDGAVRTRESRPVAEDTHRDGLCLAYASKTQTLLVGNRHGYLERYEIRMPIPKLVELCRRAVNQLVERRSVDSLCLPIELKQFLTYRDLSTSSSPINAQEGKQLSPRNKNFDQQNFSIFARG